jgi:hypothetical protein
MDFTKLHTFPINPDTKKPLLNDWPNKAKPGWVGERGTGAACGLSGIVAIDLDVHDPEANGIEAWEELGIDDSTAVINETPSGGKHLIWKDATGGEIRSSTSKVASGIDVRANGGYIALPPTPGYSLIQDQDELQPLPGALVTLLRLRAADDGPLVLDLTKIEDRSEEYLEEAIAGEAEALSKVREGGRNAALNKAAYKIAGYEGADIQVVADTFLRAMRDNGWVDDEIAEGNDPEEAFKQTFLSGWKSGQEKPRATKLETINGIPKWSKKGSATYPDVVKALKDLGYTFAASELDDRVYVNGEPITDLLDSTILSKMRELNYRSVRSIRHDYERLAYENKYHPIKAYLGDQEWDGEDHIGQLISCFNSENDRFDLYFRKWIIGAVARVYETTQNRVLILSGKQGIGKSRFVRWLASGVGRRYFISSPIDPDDKDFWKRLANRWIWEVGEFGSTTRRADQDALKFFLSDETVDVRLAYGKDDIHKPALANFISTVNPSAGLLNDTSGNRRYMMAKLVGNPQEAIDWTYEDIDVNQVWAQAKALYEAGEDWNLSVEEHQQSEEDLEEIITHDPLEDLLAESVEYTGNYNDMLGSTELWKKLTTTTTWSLGSKPRAEQMAIADAMKLLFEGEEGFDSTKKVYVNEHRVNGYRGVKWVGFNLKIAK